MPRRGPEGGGGGAPQIPEARFNNLFQAAEESFEQTGEVSVASLKVLGMDNREAVAVFKAFKKKNKDLGELDADGVFRETDPDDESEDGENDKENFADTTNGVSAEDVEKYKKEKAEAIETARQRVIELAGSGKPGEKFVFGTQKDKEKKIGEDAVIGVIKKDGTSIVPLSEVLGITDEQPVRFVYGEVLRVELEKDKNEIVSIVKRTEKGKEREFVAQKKVDVMVVTVPLEMKPEELPFLLREIARAKGALEKVVYFKEKKGKGGKVTGLTRIETLSPRAVLIRDELKKREEFAEEWGKIQEEFDERKTDLKTLRDRYKKVEIEHTKAQQPVDNHLDSLVSELAVVFSKQTDGLNPFEAYGSIDAFRNEVKRRLLRQQERLIYPFNEKINKLLLFNKAPEPDLWDETVWRPHVRTSTTVEDWLLLKKLRGYEPGMETSDSTVRQAGNTAKDLLRTFGMSTFKNIGAPLLIAAEKLGVPFDALRGIINFADKKRHEAQSYFGGMFWKTFGVKRDKVENWFEPAPLGEIQKKKQKRFEELRDQALGESAKKNK